MVVEDYAEELAKDISGDEFSFDPLLILAIIQALAAIASVWKDCKPESDYSPDDVRKYLAEGGPARRRVRCHLLAKAIRAKLTSEELAILGSPDNFVHYFIAEGVQKESFGDAYIEACEE